MARADASWSRSPTATSATGSNRQQDGVKRGEGGAEDRLAAALELQMHARRHPEGEPPFDLFVRWKPH